MLFRQKTDLGRLIDRVAPFIVASFVPSIFGLFSCLHELFCGLRASLCTRKVGLKSEVLCFSSWPACSPAFNFNPTTKSESMDELKQSLWCTKLELETIRAVAQEEIARKEEEIKQLKEQLSRAVKERDETTESYQALIRQQRQRRQQQDPSPAPATEDDGRSEESMVCESPAPNSAKVEPARPLPEKGKLLQAVMKAGPLLQTLLLAGPLPQWRRPPPPLDGLEIPPVTMPAVADSKLDRCVGVCRKRSTHEYVEGGESALHPCMRRRPEEAVCKTFPSPFPT